MKLSLKFRHIIIGLFILLALIALAALSWNALIVKTRLGQAAWIEQANQLSNLALRVTADAGRERGVTAILLGSRAEIDGHMPMEMNTLRTRVDTHHLAILKQMEALHRIDHLGTMQLPARRFAQLRRELEAARAQADRRIRGEGNTISDVEWREVMSAYIEGVANLRRTALGARTDRYHPFTDNPITKEIVYTLVEYAGRERALVGAVVAKDRPFTPAEREEVWRYQGITREAIRKLDMIIARQPISPGLVAAREAMQLEYQEQFGELRRRILDASQRGAPYPVSADTWFHSATTAINTIITLSEQMELHALKDIELLRNSSRRDAVLVTTIGSGVVWLLGFVVLLIYRRAVRPLHRLEQAVNTIASGDLSQQIAGYYADELGEVGRALEQMRLALLQNMETREHSEQQLRENEARYRAIFESLQDVYFRTTLDGRFIAVSPSAEAVTGYPPGELLEKSAIELYASPQERDRLVEALRAIGTVHNYELQIRHKHGGIIHVAINARLLHDPQSGMVIEGLVRDIGVRKQAEAAMRKMELVVEQTADLVAITDRRGVIEYVNCAFEDITGYRREEVMGRPISLLKSGHQDREFYRRMWKRLERGEVFHGLLVNRKKDGELYYEEKTITPLRNDQGEIINYISTAKDVTAKRQAEVQLQQSEKLASIGQLAAGVAHEINNPVGYINSNIGSLHHYLNDLFELLGAYEQAEAAIGDPTQRERLEALRERIDIDFLKDDLASLVEESQEGVKRVMQIVQDLKDFSRTESTEFEWADLHRGLESTLNIVHNEIKYKAEIVKELGKLPLVECVLSQINQVFMNLLVNAAHAIEERGTITLRSGTEGEDWVWIEVEDTGKGIDREHLKHIFEPFFTTKPVGTGTGLGLSLSYGIIQKHGGRIEVESKPGQGTRFRVWLPVRQQADSGGEDG